MYQVVRIPVLSYKLLVAVIYNNYFTIIVEQNLLTN